MWLLFLGRFFERIGLGIGGVYFSWWYTCAAYAAKWPINSIMAFMHYTYSIFNLRLFLSILFYNIFNLVLKRQTMVPASNFICHFLREQC